MIGMGGLYCTVSREMFSRKLGIILLVDYPSSGKKTSRELEQVRDIWGKGEKSKETSTQTGIERETFNNDFPYYEHLS